MGTGNTALAYSIFYHFIHTGITATQSNKRKKMVTAK